MSDVREKLFVQRMCRGSAQCYWARQLMAGRCVNPIRALRGKARSYAGVYEKSWNNMLHRFRRAGVGVLREPGPRGGTCSQCGCWRLDPRDVRSQLAGRR